VGRGKEGTQVVGDLAQTVYLASIADAYYRRSGVGAGLRRGEGQCGTGECKYGPRAHCGNCDGVVFVGCGWIVRHGVDLDLAKAGTRRIKGCSA
jgi:hypothetical protein